MKILNPNIGQEIVQIPKFNVYVYVTDFGTKYLLKEITVGIGQHTWQWIKMKENEPIDVSMIGGHVCSFEKAINRAVNDAYSTVYQFENYDEMFRSWNQVIYIDNITTKYEGQI